MRAVIRWVKSVHASTLLVWVFVALASGNLQAAKPGSGGGTPPAGDACKNTTGVFPAMAYSRGVYSKSGSYLKTQIFVADSLGTCEVMVYDTGDYNGPDVRVTFHYDDVTRVGTLAWQQARDNGENAATGRSVVKAAQFRVNSDGSVGGLPIAAATIYRAPVSANFGILDVELSQDGTRVAFSTENGAVNVTGTVTQQVLICTVTSCAPEIAFQTTFTSAATQSGGTHKLAIGLSPDGGERIYFIHRQPAPWSDGDLVAVDKLAGGWSLPAVIVNRDVQYGSSIGDADTFLDEPSVLSRPGEPDRVLIWSRASLNDGLPRVDIYDVGTNATPASLTHFVGTGYRPTWTVDGNILVSQLPPSQTSGISEIDLSGPCQPDGSHCAQSTLPNTVRGYAVDSAR